MTERDGCPHCHQEESAALPGTRFGSGVEATAPGSCGDLGGGGPEVGRRLVAAAQNALSRQTSAPGAHQGPVLSAPLVGNTRGRCPGPPRTDFQGGHTRGSRYCLGCWFSEAHGLEEAVQVSCSPGRGDAPPYDDISRGPHVPWESSSLTVAPVHPRCRCSAVSAAGLQGVSAQGDPWVLLCSPHCCGPSAPDHGLTRLAPRWVRVSQDPHVAALGRVSTKPRTSRDVTASPGRPPKLVVTANRKAGRSARTPSESTQL